MSDPSGPAPALAAIVPAGGRASRLGGVDKAALSIDGASLLSRVVAAARATGATQIVVVGPERAGDLAEADGVERVREEPPFGGPVAALAAALPRVQAEWAFVLAADLLRPELAVSALLAATRDADGCLLTDSDGRPQWLCGLYRVRALRTAVERLAEPAGASMKEFLGGLRLARHPVTTEAIADVDTPADARAAGIDL